MKKIFISIIALISLFGCEDPNEGELFVKPTTDELEMSMATILENSPETYSMWIEMLHYTDFYNAIKNASAKATAFCPNNKAMTEFLRKRNVSSVTELDRDYARNVVKSHIIDWQDAGNTLTDSMLIQKAVANESIDKENLFGKPITLSYGYKITDVDDIERTDDIICPDSIFLMNQAKLGKFVSTKCANGVIYMMDDVIIPNAENIVEKLEILEGDKNTYKIFAEAIKADKEIYDLACLEHDTITGESGGQIVRTYSLTCFAVPDYIMNQAGIVDVPGLKQWLVNNSNGEETDGNVALNHYLKYHLMPTKYTTDEIFNFQSEDETLIYDTKYTGFAFIVNMVNGTRTFNTDIPLLRSDIEASNGLINKVGGIMPVYHPTPVNVKWDFLNSADIISFVNSWSASKVLGNIFTSKLTATEQQVDLSDEYYDGEFGSITSFTYRYNDSKAPTKNYRHIGFMKDKYANKNTQDVAQHESYMNNYMVLNLGFAGWIEFTTPTIIAGKYKVVLHYIKDPMLNKLYSSGTMVQFNIDGEDYSTNNFLYRNQPTMPLYGNIEETLWSEVKFDASNTHTFKITTRDIRAKNETYYHLRLDYVEFVPVND